MKIVALETAGRYGSIAALQSQGGEPSLIRQASLQSNQRTAQSLAPALRNLLVEVNWDPQSIDLVAVTVGPGSFTSLRIGVTTAKTLAYAVDADIVGVNTLVALASQAPSAAGRLWTILDAQRQELFAARFDSDAQTAAGTSCNTAIVSHEAWLAYLGPGDRLMGPPLRRLAASLPEGVVVVPDEYWQLMAAAVGRAAWRAYDTGHRDDLWKLVPSYYRLSYAEEKAAMPPK